MATGKRVSGMKELDLIRKQVDRLKRGTHTRQRVDEIIDHDVPNVNQAKTIKFKIYSEYAGHLDRILKEIYEINAGREKFRVDRKTNNLITVYPHAKVVSKHPLKLETVYKAHKSYFIEDPDLFDRFLVTEELKDMQELYAKYSRNRGAMRGAKEVINAYWYKLATEYYCHVSVIAELFNSSPTNVIKGLNEQAFLDF